MPKKPQGWYAVTLRLPPELAKDVKRHADAVRKLNPDGTVSEQNVLRTLIRKGLEA